MDQKKHKKDYDQTLSLIFHFSTRELQFSVSLNCLMARSMFKISSHLTSYFLSSAKESKQEGKEGTVVELHL